MPPPTGMLTSSSTLPMRRAPASGLSLLTCARAGVAVLLVFSIVVPTILQPLKVAVLIFVLACMALRRKTWNTQATPAQLALDLAALGYSVVGMCWAIYGLLRGNPGAASMMTVHVAYPLLFLFLARLARSDDFARVSRVIWISAVLVVVSQALFIGSFFGVDGGVLFDTLQDLQDVPAVVDAGDDYLLFTLPSVSSLLFLAPWLMAHALYAQRRKLHHAVLLLLTVALLVLAGRRAFVLGIMFGGVAVLSSAGTLTGGRLGRVRPAGALLFVAVLAALVVAGLHFGWLNADIVTDRLTSIFDFSENESNLERRLQFGALMEGIATHPLVGNGLGAAATYLRSDTQPWAYELSYVALAFHVGVLGFLVYAVGVVWVLAALRRLGMDRKLPEAQRLAAVAYLGGFVSFLVVNASNPYLAKFDYMWTLFVPVAMIRAWLGARDKARAPV